MMRVGMLWFDNDKTRTLQEKIERAAAYYRQKYDAAPTACYINPAALDNGAEFQVNSVAVLPLKIVLPHHFWVGVEERT
jgi:hypothetical protein